ncbi:alkaline phosphatase [Paenibacillus sp. LHD-117]|uniref:alkaline phosphatase n=1 Tax=Paenibacillus sp. LHD-117 TaxID=3071412 RepID=UPI0027E0DBEA|nr:alkaline phosphatase [Paenibacillus sp. LHD-117]MDQ6421635.1 alkaline phosphatase [Paenibacillus sp. LHD-117]
MGETELEKTYKRFLLSGLALSLLSAVLAGSALGAETNTNAAPAAAPSKNLIIMIGDGMGTAHVTAARYYARKFLNKDQLELDNYFVGTASTYSEQSPYTTESGAVTDSSAAGTAFATGKKTYNNAVSVSNEDIAKPHASVIEAAMKIGKSTGLVTTDTLTGATPAVFASHVRLRFNQNAIASQYVDSGVNVLLGGGKASFVTLEEKGTRTDKSIIADFEARGYQTVNDAAGLDALPANSDKVLGLFGMKTLPYVIDRRDNKTPSLSQMTQKAIDILSKNKNGFTLLVEGGEIDHAAHSNDFPAAVQEVLDFDATVKMVMDFAKKDGNTSVVVTADHETGGLTVGNTVISSTGLAYQLDINLWNQPKLSGDAMVKLLMENTTTENIRKVVAEHTGFTDLTDAEVAQIKSGLNPDLPSQLRASGYNNVIARRLGVNWATPGHTAVDVGVWAYGPIASLVKGAIDNTDIAKSGAKVIGADLDAASAELQSKYLYPMYKVTSEKTILYPARAMANALGITVKWDEATRTVTLSKGANQATISIVTKAVKINGADSALVGIVDKGKLYLPLDVYNKLTGKSMTWDTLSERLVLN